MIWRRSTRRLLSTHCSSRPRSRGGLPRASVTHFVVVVGSAGTAGCKSRCSAKSAASSEQRVVGDLVSGKMGAWKSAFSARPSVQYQ
jgi:hypothetical protein